MKVEINDDQYRELFNLSCDSEYRHRSDKNVPQLIYTIISDYLDNVTLQDKIEEQMEIDPELNKGMERRSKKFELSLPEISTDNKPVDNNWRYEWDKPRLSGVSIFDKE